MAFPQIPELINMHLQPIDPITIDYTIRYVNLSLLIIII
jgi:hypothetical protein